ncbi:DUF6093 family protein [Streptomyces microflavus]|uniref:DUF6093 family protein n=1 Tax=Streptomyces microflavus TaxID=1919 RepID=UPI003B21170A
MAGLDQALAGVTRWISANLLIDTVRISLPGDGEPVLNPATGELVYPEGDTLYEGPGGVFAGAATMERSAVPDAVQPWAQQTRSSYVLFTPIDAPIAKEQAVVSVVEVHDPTRTSLLNRTWICADQGQAGTVEVVRRTALDQNRPATGGTP